MSLQDTTFLTGGYNQSIVDWELGDDRIFTGTLSGVLPASDPSFTDGYLTFKLNPNQPDSDSIFQLHITQSNTSSGQITPTGGDFIVCLFHVFSGSYEGLVLPGTVYWMDCRMISTGGTTITVATAQVTFQQNVTQTNAAGVPAALPNNGQPRFRGFISNRPDLVPYNQTIYNAGDVYFNLNPINGNGVAWSCTVGGVAPVTTWITWSVSNSVPGDVHFKGYTAAPPIGGTYVPEDYFLNSLPTEMAPEGWVYTIGGQWRTKGIIGNTDGS